MLVIMLLARPVVDKAGLSGSFHAGHSVLADPFAASGVLVAGGDIPDACVQLDGVPMALEVLKFCAQDGGLGDIDQGRVFSFQVSAECLDPRLAGRRPGRPKCSGDDH